MMVGISLLRVGVFSTNPENRSLRLTARVPLPFHAIRFVSSDIPDCQINVFGHLLLMRRLCATLLAGIMLSSCNTTIGLGRDIRDGFHWSKRKIEESRNSGGAENSGSYDDSYGAPVY
jgi:predicted small secreted protein